MPKETSPIIPAGAAGGAAGARGGRRIPPPERTPPPKRWAIYWREDESYEEWQRRCREEERRWQEEYDRWQDEDDRRFQAWREARGRRGKAKLAAAVDACHAPRGEVDTGGILHLPEALALYPKAPLVLYHRASSYGQAGRGKETLDANAASLYRQVRQLTPRRIRASVAKVEEGKLSQPRRGLVWAGDTARKLGAILVAADLSRLLRSESYDRQKNRNAWPTPVEFQELRELTGGVPLATVERPDLSEDERHSKATKRTGKAGRPVSIDDELAAKIFQELDYLYLSSRGWRWAVPLAEVARDFGVTKPAIHRASYRPSPDGRSWRDVAIAKAVEEGLMEIAEDGVIVSLVT